MTSDPEGLNSLAGQRAPVSDALLTTSGSVRNTATLLEVLVATKLMLPAGSNPANALIHRCLEAHLCDSVKQHPVPLRQYDSFNRF